MGQPRRPPRASSTKLGLGWRARRISEDGGGCSGRWRRGMLTDTLTQADAQACHDEDKGDDEGGSCDVEPKGGSAVGAAQLGDVLEVSQVWVMEMKLSYVLEGLGHLLHLSGREEVDGIPVPLVMEDTVV